jgi:hypothetical protein
MCLHGSHFACLRWRQGPHNKNLQPYNQEAERTCFVSCSTFPVEGSVQYIFVLFAICPVVCPTLIIGVKATFALGLKCFKQSSDKHLDCIYLFRPGATSLWPSSYWSIKVPSPRFAPKGQKGGIQNSYFQKYGPGDEAHILKTPMGWVQKTRSYEWEAILHFHLLAKLFICCNSI